MQSYLMTALCITGFLLPLAGQQDFSIYLKSGEISQDEMLYPGEIQGIDLANHQFGPNYYLILQFEDIPTTAKREYLALLGIKLFAYLPNYAFLASVPAAINLNSLPLKAVIPIKPEYKLSRTLAIGDFPAHAIGEEGIRLQIYPHGGVSPVLLQESLETQGHSVSQLFKKYIVLVVSPSEIPTLAAHPAVMYVEAVEAQPVAEGLKARTLQRANRLSAGPGQAYDGSGIVMAIADDGSVNHVDFRGRLIDHTTFNAGNHGDMTAGIAMGSGNINPLAMGMAPASELHLYLISNYPHITNAIENHEEYGTVITSTSYGESCGAVYSYSAQSTDNQVFIQNELLHCFSAGNSAGEGCNSVYGNIPTPDGQYYGNITGGRKAAKNVLAVGNVFYDDLLRKSSSRGPAQDGRIKPDICANGQGNLTTDSGNDYRLGGGTSAAAPALAGSAALLYEAYQELNGGIDPSSGLIKAIILNTAEDLGRPGPDYDFGWGRVNISRALEILENQQYLFASVPHEGENIHQLTVPGGVKQLRVMVYWHDPAGSPLAVKALVNDLDISLNSPTGQSYRPWVLSTFAHADSLAKPAYQGIDRLNNMEQLSLNNPAPGNYSIEVKGYTVPQGPQHYYLVYYFQKDEIAITYPAGGEGFVPGETEVLRWDAFGNSGSFKLEYSVDSLNSWNVIADGIEGDKRHFDWMVPGVVSANVFFRVRRNGKAAVSAGRFSIIPQADFWFEHVSDSTARIVWNSVAGADFYEVYELGEKYMEVIGSTADTSYEFAIGLWEKNWYSLRVTSLNGLSGRRAYAKNYYHVPCNTNITITLNFDLYPQEISWKLKNAIGQVLASGGPYLSQAANASLVIQQCLPYGCYDFVIYDSYDDGMCCAFGEGSYELRDAYGNILATGGQFGSSESTNFCLDPPVNPLAIEVSDQSDLSCNGTGDGWILVNASGGFGDYSYSWSNGSSSNFIDNLSGGSYSVTVSDGVAVVSAVINIGEPSAVSLEIMKTDLSCNHTNDGSIVAIVSGGTGPYTFSWNNGATGPSIDSLSAGIYSLTLSDDHSCEQVAEVTIEQGNTLNITLEGKDVSCNGLSDGSVSVNVSEGDGVFSYSWSNGASGLELVNLAPGLYSITVSNDFGCTAAGSIAVNEPLALIAEIISTDLTCQGVSDGMVEAVVSGGTGAYSYLWNTGSNTAILAGLAAGNYSLTLNDGNGCTLIDSSKLSEPEAMALNAVITNVTEGMDGAIELSVSGGVPGYSYIWSNGAITENISGLLPGDYSVTVSDANNCPASLEMVVTNENPDYCISSGSNTNFEWIESVQIGDFSNVSGNDGGYGDYSAISLELLAGEVYTFSLTPGLANNTYHEKWRVWIDFNDDGDFADAGEEVLSINSNAVVNETLTIPAAVVLGTTRMRISMKYGSPAPFCGIFAYGEVEDYSLHIADTLQPLAVNMPQGNADPLLRDAKLNRLVHSIPVSQAQLKFFPNPASYRLKLEILMPSDSEVHLKIVDAMGGIYLEKPLSLSSGQNGLDLDIKDWPAGHYFLSVIGNQYRLVRKLVVVSQ